MKRFTRWTIALAATAILAAPAAAQQPSPEPPQNPAQQPTPAEPTPPTPTEPGQPTPTTPPSPPPAAPQPGAAQDVDTEGAKRHLTLARDTLSEMTQLPAAAQLTGDARTQVSQLITNFNELITTNVEWRASYGKVVENLNALIGDQRADESPQTPAAGTPGAVGTSGRVALDPSLRAKLIEFRTHLSEFEKAADGSAPSASSATMPGNTTAAGSTSTPPSSVTSSAATAAAGSEAARSTSTAGSTEPPQATGTSGTTTTSSASAPATATSEPEPQSRPDPARTQTSEPAASQREGHAEALRHIEAIETILKGQAPDRPAGTSGTASGERTTSLDRDQIEQIRSHLAELRRLISSSGEPK